LKAFLCVLFMVDISLLKTLFVILNCLHYVYTIKNKKPLRISERLVFVGVGTTDEISKQLLEDIEVLANLERYLNI
jgi:hypothetical protein